MRHPVPIILAALLALSLPVSAVGTAGTAGSTGSATVANESDDEEQTFQFQNPSVSVEGDHAQLEGTPNRLVLRGDGKTAYATPTLDFALAVSSHDESIHTDCRTYAFENSLGEIEDDENRTEAVVSELERIEERVEKLREREQAIVAANAAGDVSEDEVLRTLARNSYEAQVLQQALNDLDDQSAGIIDISDSVDALTAELEVYRGPIRTDIERSIRGVDESDDAPESNPTILLESAPDGLTLSMLDGDTYVRETTRYDNRARDRSDQIRTMDNARTTAQELYPWAFETTSGTYTIKHEATNLYQVQALSHDQGQLTVYLDGGSNAVYHERQTLDRDSIPIETTDSMSSDNVTATLERTPDTAPARITVTESESETPVDATVSVDGTVVGETGEDGKVWFVPPTDGFELTVRAESTSLNAVEFPRR
ncbi:hypothetical protein JMJ58_11750 [Haloterrigena salifodinae]|uniref:Uncharacterized protein n=1 Tax=Haloterrigena salifodinae TaxID=2675099 RepID=A0A8T8DWI8_9EURY|nr:hypothetical protein [Haloterrigena salifodinae]QRV13631.1 hypothetical protein JMJ58_11750 [Haloterrigena salifodinae]